MTDASAWFAARTAGAPAALRARAAEYLERVPVGGAPAARLAAAAQLALDGTLGRGKDRAAALDLLTADALLTLALLAEAETAPATLDRFAAALVSGTAE